MRIYIFLGFIFLFISGTKKYLTFQVLGRYKELGIAIVH
mgnify:CR=1 FL=1